MEVTNSSCVLVGHFPCMLTDDCDCALQRLGGKKIAACWEMPREWWLWKQRQEEARRSRNAHTHTNGFWRVALWRAVPNLPWHSVSTFQEIHSNACSELRCAGQIPARWWYVVCMKDSPVIGSNISSGVNTSERRWDTKQPTAPQQKCLINKKVQRRDNA